MPKPKCPKPGIYYGVPDAKYRAWPAISQSGLRSLARSPAHFISDSQDSKDTPAKKLGRAFHAAILQPDVFEKKVKRKPPFGRTTEGLKDKAEWEAEYADCEWLTDAEVDHILNMQEAVLAHPIAGRLFKKGRSEVSLVWRDPDYGVLCKCRLDHWLGGLVADLKTCLDARRQAFERDIRKFNYQIQPPFYLDGIYAHTGKFCNPWLYVAVEKSPPYGVCVYEVRPEDDDVHRAREEYKALLAIYSECVKTKEWPGYEETVAPINLYWRQFSE